MAGAICRQARWFLLQRPSLQHVPRATSAAVASMRDIISAELDDIRDAGTWKSERVITTKQAAEISVLGRPKPVLNFCANNYLGLSSHPDIVAAGRAVYNTHGAGLSSVRFICGTQDIHKELEDKIAKFHGREEAILYSSCYDANAGIFEVLMKEGDAIISDELNHASIIDGIRLSKAERQRYKHRDMKDLERLLQETQNARMRLIVTDGVFSMDGNVAPLREICDLADEYKALVFVDESHATGHFGKTGRGTEEYLGLEPGRVDMINSTLGKALGGASGGYTTGSKELIDLLRNRSRPYLFSNSLPPPVVATASKVFELLMKSSELIEKLAANTHRFRNRMSEAGFTVLGDKDHPISPVLLTDEKLAAKFAEEMLERGIYVIGFSYPVVPKGKARIRVQLSAGHSLQNVDTAVDAFIETGKQLKVIS
ncbi:2-amino-3-ketobutyrate coenzyme A ligase, mitochondrial [Lamellibrachia satsuma]|nr:2-amino-3-ketobutyrate coenzyme A ligase, mitochondrial [Lamellibrachia satsuma]